MVGSFSNVHLQIAWRDSGDVPALVHVKIENGTAEDETRNIS